MTPKFNLMASRFTAYGTDWAYGSEFIQDQRSYLTLTVRKGSPAHAVVRRVKGYKPTVWN